MSSRAFHVVVALAALTGCQGTEVLRPEGAKPDPAKGGATPLPHDPNEIIVQTDGDSAPLDSGGPASHLSARTTLLEDNEHLRDMLAKALAERRDCEQKLSDTSVRAEQLDREVVALRESVAQLSEQLDAQTTKIAELERVKSKLEKDRSTLAEMYALEKRQRLAFEKELLEREIRTRTLSKDG